MIEYQQKASVCILHSNCNKIRRMEVLLVADSSSYDLWLCCAICHLLTSTPLNSTVYHSRRRLSHSNCIFLTDQIRSRALPSLPIPSKSKRTMNKSYPFYQVDAFTETKLGGNPCAVFLDADDMSDATMLAVAKEVR